MDFNKPPPGTGVSMTLQAEGTRAGVTGLRLLGCWECLCGGEGSHNAAILQAEVAFSFHKPLLCKFSIEEGQKK